MTVEQAIKWLDPTKPNEIDHLIEEIERNNLQNTDATDLIVGKINEACSVACDVMRFYLSDNLHAPAYVHSMTGGKSSE